jgi:hypothetical protein
VHLEELAPEEPLNILWVDGPLCTQIPLEERLPRQVAMASGMIFDDRIFLRISPKLFTGLRSRVHLESAAAIERERDKINAEYTRLEFHIERRIDLQIEPKRGFSSIIPKPKNDFRHHPAVDFVVACYFHH